MLFLCNEGSKSNYFNVMLCSMSISLTVLLISGIMKFMGDYPMGSSQNEVDCALKLLKVRK